MFHKKLLIVLLPVIAVLAFSPVGASAGGGFVSANLTIAAAPPRTITVGGSVTFTLTFACSDPWTSASAQLFNGLTMSNENKLGSLVSLEYPSGTIIAQSANRPAGSYIPVTVTETKTITFNQVGTFTVNASIPEAVYNDGSNIRAADACEIASTSTLTIEVEPVAQVPPSVASATTTTVAATTTTAATTLPKTGTDSNNALIALAVMTAGVAIIAGRRRLLTK